MRSSAAFAYNASSGRVVRASAKRAGEMVESRGEGFEALWVEGAMVYRECGC